MKLKGYMNLMLFWGKNHFFKKCKRNYFKQEIKFTSICFSQNMICYFKCVCKDIFSGSETVLTQLKNVFVILRGASSVNISDNIAACIMFGN